jgi:UDP-N-acetylglucosamine 2-epimerase (non-hydrolysing)
MSQARIVLTDSGGLQEETTALGIPCLTLRESTERPITVAQGTNTIVGVDPRRIVSAARAALGPIGERWRVPELWDGRASERIAEVLATWTGEADAASRRNAIPPLSLRQVSDRETRLRVCLVSPLPPPCGGSAIGPC